MQEKETSPVIVSFPEPVHSAGTYLLCSAAGRVLFASGALKLIVGEDLTGRCRAAVAGRPPYRGRRG